MKPIKLPAKDWSLPPLRRQPPPEKNEHRPLTALQRLGITWSVQEGLTWHGRSIDAGMRDFLLACQADEDLISLLRQRAAQLAKNPDTAWTISCSETR